MGTYGKCGRGLRCPDCGAFSARWGGVAVCGEYRVVLGTEDLRERVRRRIEAIAAIQRANRERLGACSYAEERRLPEAERRLCAIWEEYRRRRLEVTPWLEGGGLTDPDRENLYRFFEAADRAEHSFD